MPLSATLAACVLAVSARYHLPRSQIAAVIREPAASADTVGFAHIPRAWVPLLDREGFHAPDLEHSDCENIAAAGWILAYGREARDAQRRWRDAGKLPARARVWQPAVEAYAREAGISASLVNAVIMQESRFHTGAVSLAGAIGLMQLTPATANALRVNPYDPAQNLWGGVWYLADLLKAYGGDLALALAAYNAGPAAVARYGGIPPYRETRAYVPAVLNRYSRLLAQQQAQPLLPER